MSDKERAEKIYSLIDELKELTPMLLFSNCEGDFYMEIRLDQCHIGFPSLKDEYE